MIKTPTAAVHCWPRCRCRPPSTATPRGPTPSTPTPWASPRPCSTWGCPPCPTSLLGSSPPTSQSQASFLFFGFLVFVCFCLLTTRVLYFLVWLFSLAGMSSLMSSSFAAMTPFTGPAYTQLTASAKWERRHDLTSYIQTYSLCVSIIIKCYQFKWSTIYSYIAYLYRNVWRRSRRFLYSK